MKIVNKGEIFAERIDIECLEHEIDKLVEKAIKIHKPKTQVEWWALQGVIVSAITGEFIWQERQEACDKYKKQKNEEV